jgi:hypothetical protein
MRSTKNLNSFINHVKIVTSVYNLKFKLKNTSYLIADNLRCVGWFDEDYALVVAKNNPEWVEVLVHEYSHLTQFVENNEIWKNGGQSTTVMNEWLNGKKVKNINTHIDNVKLLELDNEKRSVQTIKDFNLDVDTNKYIRRANAYVQFHNWMKISKKWIDHNNSPLKNPRILNSMSNKFNMNYDKLSPKLIRIFEEEKI